MEPSKSLSQSLSRKKTSTSRRKDRSNRSVVDFRTEDDLEWAMLLKDDEDGIFSEMLAEIQEGQPVQKVGGGHG